jgi:hypothetical protein
MQGCQLSQQLYLQSFYLGTVRGWISIKAGVGSIAKELEVMFRYTVKH